jgi:hypothetical protein
LRHNPEPNAISGLPFSCEVAPPYAESWSEELQLFHNPNARIPINPRSLPTIAHHSFVDDDLVSLIPKDQVLSSVTSAIVPVRAE